MPFIYRRGRIFIGRETGTYGTPSSSAMPGMLYGPHSGLMATTLGAQAGIPGLAIPTLTRELEGQQFKHQAPSTVGRRMEDFAQVQARRNGSGQITGEVMPNSFGLLLFLTLGADSVAPTASGTTAGTNSANATTLNVSTGLPALSSGQYIWINDGANSEYVKVNGNQAANTLAIPINGGAGTGGGLKFGHAAALPIQLGPWTHTMTPSITSNPTWQAEDNWGGSANSLLYTGMLIDSLELNCPIDNDTEALTYAMKVLGKAPAAAGVAASPIPTGSPIEELAIAAGNNPAVTVSGATDTTIYVPDYKMTLANGAKLAKAQVSAPDPYFAIGPNFSVRGSMETIFEDYGVFQDYMNNTIWSPLTITHTWPQQLMPAGGASAAVAASLAIQIKRFAIEKAGKPTMKDDFVHLPIENWRGEDYPDFANVVTATLVNNVASY